MKILTVLTYYRPHTSGLTIYAERLARAFAKRSHEVTVMTTQYDKSLPLEEMMEGVRVIRVPVAFRLSKGVIAPTFGWVATKLVRQHDVVQMHLPQFAQQLPLIRHVKHPGNPVGGQGVRLRLCR